MKTYELINLGSKFLKGEIHEEMNENLRLKDQDLKLKNLT